MNDLFSLHSSGLPESARLVAFRGHEALCRPYRFEIFFVLVDEGDFDMSDAIGSKATLRADRADGTDPVQVHGILTSIEHLHELDGRALYRAVLVPRLALLAQTRHSRLFTEQSLPQILQTVLEEGGLAGDEYELRLDATYEVEEHVCQYHESDLDFVHRWLESEGLYYFFEHREDHEVLVITDHRSFHAELDRAPIRYHPLSGDDRSAGSCFDSFKCQHGAMPEKVRLTDYDYARPNLELAGSATVCPMGAGEVVVHGSRFFTPQRGQRLADVRAEELRAGQVVHHAAGTALHVRSGYTFRLADHGRDAFNTTYLAVEVQHFGNQAVTSPEIRRLVGAQFDDVYRVEARAIRADVQYRPRRTTAWPRVHGLEHGVVDGEGDSDYAQIDDHGRYRVKLGFDESELRGGKASTWVRMMQPHGGSVEGWHFPLRKGTEVVLAFLGGDPDRPVIAGVAPNALRPSPVTALNRTTNVIQTGGRNRIEMEDLEGSQRITISSPYKNSFLRLGAPNDDSSIMMVTEGNKKLWVGGDLTVQVVCGRDQNVCGDDSLDVHGTTSEVHHGFHSTRSGSGRFVKVDCGATYEISGGETRTIYGDYALTSSNTEVVTGNLRVTAPSNVTHLYGALSEMIDSQDTVVSGAVNITAGGAFTVNAPGGIHQVGTSTLKTAAHAEEAVGFKLQAIGLGLAIYGIKLDVSGAFSQQRGTDLTECTTNIGSICNWITTSAAKVVTAGVAIFL